MHTVIGGIVGILILVVAVLIVVDVASTPAPTGVDTCSLVHRYVLPDTCVCLTAGRTCSWFTTRPYLFFFTQAASCGTLCDIDLR
jgi:hypothetical protein